MSMGAITTKAELRSRAGARLDDGRHGLDQGELDGERNIARGRGCKAEAESLSHRPRRRRGGNLSKGKSRGLGKDLRVQVWIIRGGGGLSLFKICAARATKSMKAGDSFDEASLLAIVQYPCLPFGRFRKYAALNWGVAAKARAAMNSKPTRLRQSSDQQPNNGGQGWLVASEPRTELGTGP